MSSTTDRRRERGQVLAIFAFGLVGILAIAALVFDVGQNLFERRKQQDAADAAALAGARFMPESACRANPDTTTCARAVSAALELVVQHGYDPSQVTINVPPDNTSRFADTPGHIQVTITSDRGSYFAGVLGMASFRVSAQAVAANIDNYPLPYSILALNSSGGEGCKAGHITGNGTITIEGDVMVSATCESPGALSFDGSNVVVDVAGQCATAGDIDFGPSTTVDCEDGYLEDQTPVTDPLSGLEGPDIGSAAVPSPPAGMVVTGAHAASNRPPTGCPGSSTPATRTNATGCDVHFNREKVVRIYPGVYWGGLKLRETSDPLTVYMEPGIYYMAGGGFEVSGAVNLYSVEPGGTTFGAKDVSGVMIYNTDHPSCPGGGPCIGAVDFQNTSGGSIRLRGYAGPVWEHLLVYQDRGASSQPAFKMEGSTSMTVSGTFYLPKANFDYAGQSAGEVLNAQVICDTFKVSGNGGLTITYDPEEAVQLSGVGLVQ